MFCAAEAGLASCYSSRQLKASHSRRPWLCHQAHTLIPLIDGHLMPQGTPKSPLICLSCTHGCGPPEPMLAQPHAGLQVIFNSDIATPCQCWSSAVDVCLAGSSLSLLTEATVLVPPAPQQCRVKCLKQCLSQSVPGLLRDTQQRTKGRRLGGPPEGGLFHAMCKGSAFSYLRIC